MRSQDLRLLLAMNTAIASIHDRDELLRVIMQRLQPVFDFCDVRVFVPEFDGRHHRQLIALPHQLPTLTVQGRRRVSCQLAGHPGSLVERLMQAETPQAFTVAAALAEYPDYVPFQRLTQAGIQSCLTAPLRCRGETIGLFWLNSPHADHFRADQFALFAAVCDQLAVAVSNIVAHEDRLERAQEQTLLLDIGRAIATIREKTDLLPVINQRILPVFGHSIAGIFTLTADGQRHRDWMVEIENTVLDKEVNQVLGSEYAHAGTVIALMMEHDQPDLYDLQQTQADGHGHPQLPLMLKQGLRYAIAAPLRVGGRVIGVFTVVATQPDAFAASQLPLFGAIADQLAVAVANIGAHEEVQRLEKQLRAEKAYLLEELNTSHNFGDIIGSSTTLRAVFQRVRQVAPTDTTVLIEGETGTGKELIARALHRQSSRHDRVLVKLNCATLPAQLIESELFGHEKGAFTGAYDRRIGKFELAHRGTIFLDEVGELPLELQAKLLRVLQEREIERVGGQRVIATDVRVIAATNRNLAQEVAAGRFRADLYYRLSVFPIQLPPLRERRDDIFQLATYFGQKFCRRLNRPFVGIRERCLPELLAYEWPGNVRELENVMEQAVIISNGQALDCGRTLANQPATVDDGAGLADAAPGRPTDLPRSPGLRAERDELERARIVAALHQTKWRIRGPGGAAERLHIKPTTLEARMKKLAIIRK